MDDLQLLFSRRHPLVAACEPAWDRTRQAYAGGRAYIEAALVKHMAESVPAFDERKARAYYVNLPRKIARLISNFLLSAPPQRDGADAAVADDWSRDGRSADDVMLQVSTMLNCYGLAWVLVDMPKVAGAVDLETKQRQRIRPFARPLSPFKVRDWANGPDGRLQWALVAEWRTADDDPFAERATYERRRLWTRTDWRLFEKGKDGAVAEVEKAVHGLGAVPLVMLDEPDGFGIGSVSHWFEDVVRLSDAILNNGSEAQMNIVKQMFGLLVISEQFANSRSGLAPTATETIPLSSREDLPVEDTESFAHAIGRSVAIWETAEEKGLTRYIGPTGAETAAIRAENAALKEELFDMVGLALQHGSKQAQTAESKAWDSVAINQGLAWRAGLLEQCERRAWELFHAWDSTVEIPNVAYNRDFAVKDIEKTVASIMELSSFDAGREYGRETMRAALAALNELHPVPAETQERILAEIDKLDGTPTAPAHREPQDV